MRNPKARCASPGALWISNTLALRSHETLPTTKAKGTGLGLAIVGRVIETHRGELKIKSRLGHGTTITVSLPV